MKIQFSDYLQYSGKEENSFLFAAEHLAITSGQLNVLVGESGSGKTTFLNTLCKRNGSYKGNIEIDGINLTDIKNPLVSYFSYVPVDNTVIDQLTLEDHLRLTSKDKKKQQEILDCLQLSSLREKRADTLSKGEQIRLSIAVSVLRGTPILLFDEPTANLDEENKERVFFLLSSLSKTHLVLVTTHDSDSIKDDVSYCRFEIRNKKLSALTENQVPTSSVPLNRGKKSTSPLSLRKTGLLSCFKHKVQLAFSTILCSLLLFGTFFSFSASKVNYHDTLLSAIGSLPYDYTGIDSSGIALQDNHFIQCSYADYPQDEKSDRINLACLEDLNSSLKKKCQDLFDSFTLPDSTRQNSHNHKVILTEEQIDYFSRSSLNRKYKVGDIIPISLVKNTYAISHEEEKDHFVLAGILDYGTDRKDKRSLNSLFPCIIEQKDYLECLENTGRRISTYNSSFYSLAESYREYRKQHGLENTFTLPSDKNYGLYSILPYSKVKNRLKEESETEETDNSLYYQGIAPEKEEEIWLPDSGPFKGVSKIFQNDSTVREREDYSFFKPYLKGNQFEFPLSDCFGSLSLTNPSSFCITGTFHTHSEDYTRNDCVIVSDALFKELESKIIQGNKEGYRDNTSIPCFADRFYLEQNVQAIQDKTLTVHSDTRTACRAAYSNRKKTSRFFSCLSLALAILSFVISVLYILNRKKELVHSFAVLTLLGKSAAEKLLVLFSALSPLAILSLTISLCLSEPLTRYFRHLFALSDGFLGTRIIPSRGYSYLLLVAVWLIFFLISVSLSYLGKKKKAIQQIKEND